MEHCCAASGLCGKEGCLTQKSPMEGETSNKRKLEETTLSPTIPTRFSRRLRNETADNVLNANDTKSSRELKMLLSKGGSGGQRRKNKHSNWEFFGDEAKKSKYVESDTETKKTTNKKETYCLINIDMLLSNIKKHLTCKCEITKELHSFKEFCIEQGSTEVNELLHKYMLKTNYMDNNGTIEICEKTIGVATNLGLSCNSCNLDTLIHSNYCFGLKKENKKHRKLVKEWMQVSIQ